MFTRPDPRNCYGEERWIAIGWLTAAVAVVIYTELPVTPFESFRPARPRNRRCGSMPKPSKTDFQRLAEMADEEIDTTEIPELDEAFFRTAELRLPSKKAVTIRLDSDVLEWFKAQGSGYQTRINQLLRHYMQAHS
jgi:uncharacterized protein (DUF4415 family)